MSLHPPRTRGTRIAALRTLPLLAAVLLFAACTPLPRAAAPHPLTVVTYNIQYGGGGANLPAIIEVIRGLRPDIIALQEVDVAWSARSGFEDQATALAEALGMEMRFAPIYTFPDTAGERPARQFGLALLSRHPIVAFTNHDLTRLSTQSADATPLPQPGFLEATVAIGETRLRVFNTHLDYRRDPAVREIQVAEMLALIGNVPGPTLLLGDLNAGPTAPEIQPLLRRFHDAWEHGEGPGFTMTSDVPTTRIDYILVSDDVRVLRAHVPETTASDHRPVVAEVEIGR
jgi:endonuclease/exonuclease/phosphatase family metal-dependent hydrolase